MPLSSLNQKVVHKFATKFVLPCINSINQHWTVSVWYLRWRMYWVLSVLFGIFYWNGVLSISVGLFFWLGWRSRSTYVLVDISINWDDSVLGLFGIRDGVFVTWDVAFCIWHGVSRTFITKIWEFVFLTYILCINFSGSHRFLEVINWKIEEFVAGI